MDQKSLVSERKTHSIAFAHPMPSQRCLCHNSAAGSQRRCGRNRWAAWRGRSCRDRRTRNRRGRCDIRRCSTLLLFADDMKSGSRSPSCSDSHREARQRRHHKSRRRHSSIAEQQAYPWLFNPNSIRIRRLRNDNTPLSRDWDRSNRTKIKRKPPDVDRRRALTLSCNIGDGNLLRPQALRNAHSPCTTHRSSGCRRLRQNIPRRRVG